MRISLFFLVLCLSICTVLPNTTHLADNTGTYKAIHEWLEQGISYRRTGKADSAIYCFSKAFQQYDNQLNDEQKHDCALAYLQTGSICYEQDNFILALQLYINGLKISESCSKKDLIPRFYNNIGSVYGIYQDYESAINFFQRGINLYRQTVPADSSVLYNLYINLSGTYSYTNDYQNARKCYEQAMKYMLHDDSVYSYLKDYHLGLLTLQQDNGTKAVRLFHSALQKARKYNLPSDYICSVYEELYKYYDRKQQKDSMLHYAQQCIHIAELSNYTDLLLRTYKHLSDFYDRCNQHTQSIYYKERYLTLMDSTFNQRAYYHTKNMHLIYEADLLNQKISTLTTDKQHRDQIISLQQIILFSIGGALLIISVLLMWIWLQNRRLQNSYRNLFLVNEELIASEKYCREQIRYYQNKDRQCLICEDQNQKRNEIIQEKNVETQPTEKYSSSSLSDTKKKELLISIRAVMEQADIFCQDDFTLEKLSKIVGSNSRYVSQVINEEYGKNFTNYINEFRIREACIRLTDKGTYSNYTIQAIAESVGFKSPSSFVKIFRKITGITPSLYRNLSQE